MKGIIKSLARLIIGMAILAAPAVVVGETIEMGYASEEGLRNKAMYRAGEQGAEKRLVAGAQVFKTKSAEEEMDIKPGRGAREPIDPRYGMEGITIRNEMGSEVEPSGIRLTKRPTGGDAVTKDKSEKAIGKWNK
jgi:hypothetical protein